MSQFEETLARLLEEPDEVLGILADIVGRGRLQADDLPTGLLAILSEYDLVVFLVEKKPRQPTRTWVFPSPFGLRLYATLEREAERIEKFDRTGPVRR